MNLPPTCLVNNVDHRVCYGFVGTFECVRTYDLVAPPRSVINCAAVAVAVAVAAVVVVLVPRSLSSARWY